MHRPVGTALLRAIFAFVVLFAASAAAHAQPSIVSTSGTWSHKSTVTIAGSGFGSKAAAAPVVWDDASGANVSDKWDGAWPSCGGNSDFNLAYRTPSQVGRNIPLPHAHTARYIAGAHNGPIPSADCGYAVMMFKSRPKTAFPAYSYASWYQRSDDRWVFGGDNNLKTFAFSAGNGPYESPNNWYVAYNTPDPNNRTDAASYVMNDDSDFTTLMSPDTNGHLHWWDEAVNPTSGVWTKVEMEIKYTDQSDGFVRLWENGVLRIDYAGSTDRYEGDLRTEGIGGYARMYSQPDNWRYFGDVYLDYSRAHVILGNAPTLSASTIREVQVPTAWSNGSITVSVNLGAFSDHQAAYLYVVDGDGNVNAVGRPVNTATGGAVIDTTLPTVSLSKPTGGSSVSGVVQVEASASDNIGIAGVTLRVDGVAIGVEDTTSPFSVAWNSATATNGSHVLTAVARDAAGNQKISSTITVTTNNVSAPTTTGLVVSYAFDDGTGTTLSDTSGHDHPGTVSGGAAWTTAGHHGSALRFDGVDDLVTIPGTPDLNLGTGMTLEAWVNPSSLSGWETVLMKTRPPGTGETEAGLSYALYANNGTPNPAATANTDGADRETVGSAQLPMETWTHLAATYDGTLLRLFVNGTERASQPVAGPLLSSTRPLFIGGNDVWGEFFEGLIDDVRVYNRPLTAAQIQVDMATPVVAPPPPTTSTTTVFGPKTYTSNGIGVLEKATFNVTDTSGEYALHVVNSGTIGSVIQLNGRVVLRPPDARIETIDIPVTVRAGSNQLVTGFIGKRGTSLTVSVLRRPVAPPACVITSPADGATLFRGEAIQVTATATDNVRVTQLQFRSSDGSLRVDDSNSPWSAPFVVPVVTGSLTITATVYDHVRNAGVCSTTVNVIQGPPPTVSLSGLTAASVLVEGATIPITVNATGNRVPVAQASLVVNGVTLGSDASAPFSFLFTVPKGVNWLNLRASAVNNAGVAGSSGDVIVTVVPDPLTTVKGRVEDASRKSVSGADVSIGVAHGLLAEIFDFHTTLSAMPNLSGKTPSRTSIVSAANLRNPNALFGANPFGFGLGSHAVRLTGDLRVTASGIYTFVLGVNEGGRFLIAGVTIVDIPRGSGVFKQSSARVWLPPGSWPIEIRSWDNGNPEVQLSYTPPDGVLRVVPQSALSPSRSMWSTRSNTAGSFSLAGVPTVLGDIDAAITFTPSRGRAITGDANPVAPVVGGATDLGLIRLR